ncbi:type VII secretion-associated serine protease mycosin [Micromonospora sp. WMMD882]|uniref:type VII secretion-associated serine protease mycosin n=1 Tax=Micromonospora sp. WMMD882 TaxID=3015151 RepID=UPI00248B3068|nr:type VII secretion-associated serine protease mycosin [Micromonospora sp. WMMD882]WBB77493.1 type VII secretion-associated serine protease mycosin [Micromonospora sp. WMMD882]
MATVVLPAAPAQADRIRNDQWHLRYLKVAEAHKITRGEGVTVAILDTGVDRHPDLRSNLLRGIDIVAGGSGDGSNDLHSHGTAMAGLVAAHGRATGIGALGIAPAAKILPITTSSKDNRGTIDDLAAGIEFALTKDADVINISSTGGPNARLQQAVEAAIEADVVVVASAGNYPLDYTVGYPARHPGVIAIGGIDQKGNQAQVSITGREIDVVAPATDIYSTSYDGKYAKGSGTSSATAIVAGAVALIRARFPELSAREVAHRLTATAVDKGAPGRDDEYGYGVIDLVAALTADVPPLVSESPTASAPADVTPTSAVAAPDGDGGGGWSLAAGGLAALGGGVVALGGFAWALAARRRRRAGADRPGG